MEELLNRIPKLFNWHSKIVRRKRRWRKLWEGEEGGEKTEEGDNCRNCLSLFSANSDNYIFEAIQSVDLDPVGVV